ncbi:wall-associated receptor kinase 4-like [Schistocerca piceifrons]|uniref:wall-associated receptor kinase 4-like n=1 Tax=Schistocerca piceifrons TaxID=274613 RepID=UPI001F5EBA07|nr:wall-associated receptor kinase 4-like [Schistocerca piceifrons]XP_049952617.1 uncharacterized protein LOC126469542 [Schistocerca serialis cubense]
MAINAELRSLLVLLVVCIALNHGVSAGQSGVCTTPCGENAFCKKGLYPSCECNEGFYGNPYNGCSPTGECTVNEDCEDRLACSDHVCVSLCSRYCPLDAPCFVTNHVNVECEHKINPPSE